MPARDPAALDLSPDPSRDLPPQLSTGRSLERFAQPSTGVTLDPALAGLRGQEVLLVASSGGHIVEAMRLAEVLGFAAGSRYVTFDTPQTRGLLAGRRASYVPYVPPRGMRPMLVAARHITRLPLGDYACVFSTGSAIAVSGWLAAQRHRRPTVYVESLARTRGPSLTGRILHGLPNVRLYTQHPAWSGDRWRVCPSALGAFTALRPDRPPATPGHRRIFVTLGTIHPYRFDRLVDRVLELADPGDEITWQLGATDRTGLPGRASAQLSTAEFDACMLRSDVVIAQAGVGTLLRAMELGVSPITVPRRAVHHEHVDDHQVEIAEALHRQGLALLRSVEDLGPADLRGPRPRIAAIGDVTEVDLALPKPRASQQLAAGPATPDTAVQLPTGTPLDAVQLPTGSPLDISVDVRPETTARSVRLGGSQVDRPRD